eukprot:gene21426-22291_t
MKAGSLMASLNRIRAMVLRYVYLLRGSWARIFELIYWPTVQMVTWGFLQSYLGQAAGGPNAHLALAGGILIGAMLLWDILLRGQLGFSIGFLEEMWSRNIGNRFMSPLRPLEFVASLVILSILRLAISMVPVTLMAIVFFGYNLWGLGVALGFFFANLLFTAWAIGLVVCGIVLRNGMGAEGLVWGIVFVMMPFCCVYYPVATLPGWMQAIAWSLPPTYVFEGLRALTERQILRWDLMVWSVCINLFLFTISVTIFIALVNAARRACTFLQTGE